MSLLLAAPLAACAGDDTSDSDSETAGSTTTSTTSTTSTASATVTVTAGETETSTTTTSTTSATDTSTTGDATEPLDDLLEYLGGADLEAMTSFVSESSGTRYFAGEGVDPGAPAMEVSTFDAVTSVEIGSASARIDYDRISGFLGGAPLVYSELYNGELGYIEGDDNLLVPGDTNAAMLSSRWASGRQQLALLHPHLLVLDALAGERTAATSAETLDGCDGVVEVSDDVSPIYLCVGADGELLRLETMLNDFLHRDSALEVVYADWGGDTVMFPGSVAIRVDGDDVHTETRTVTVNPDLDAAIFELPDGGGFDQALADFGALSHQFFQGFSSIGIALDALQLFVMPMELTPGVWLILGSSHNSMVVEQEAGLVVVEAPLYPERADAIIAWAEETFPGKPITHVIATHHHTDHTAGLRSFVAAGVPVVLHANAEAFFADEVFTAPSTISPDALENAPMDATIMAVGAEPLVLDDPIHAVNVVQLPTGHASDMVLAQVLDAAANMVFESDLYTPGNGGAALAPSFAQELLDAINGLDDPTQLVVGGHGGAAPLQELIDFLN